MSTAVSTSIATPSAPVSTLAPPVLTPIRRQRFSTLTRVEVRKMFNTRSSRWILALTVVVPAIVLAVLMANTDSIVPAAHGYLYGVTQAVIMIVPLLGLLAMTAEWTQRTALTTFTQSPRRGRVLAAKFLGAMTLSAIAVVVVTGLSAGALWLVDGSFDNFGSSVRALVITAALQVIMAVGFGALAAQTAAAVAAFYVAPLAWTVVATPLMGANARWLDIFSSYQRLASDTPFAHFAETMTSFTFWVLIPVIIGVWRSLRREVK